MLERFVEVLRSCSAYDLSDYSDKSLRRRLDKLLEDEHLQEDELLARIQRDPLYAEHVVNTITVNTSELFRDPPMWQALRVRMLAQYAKQSTVNIWHAGCSRGQEVYSMLILLEEMGLFDRARVYASDINGLMLALAAQGEYRFRFNLSYLDNFDQVVNVNPLNYEERPSVSYSKYIAIDRDRDVMRMDDRLRSKPVFRQNDLVRCENPFYVKFDIIFCRNVIIYFNSQLQNRLFEFFHRHLYPGGILVLGHHEMILGPWADSFNRMSHLYIKKG